MIETPKTKRLEIVTLILIALTIAASLFGIIRQDMYKPFVSNAQLAVLLSRDILSLIAAIALIFVHRAMRKGAPRCAWIWSGLVAYLFFNYAVYTLDGVYTFMYPAYVAIFSLSLFGLGLLYFCLQPEALTLATYARQPRTLFASYFLINAVVFSLKWIPQVFSAIRSQTPPPSNAVVVIDLILFIPLMVVGAVQLWKRTLLGHALAGMLLIKTALLGLTAFISQWLYPGYGLALEWNSIILFAVLGLAGVVFSVLFILRLEIN